MRILSYDRVTAEAPEVRRQRSSSRVTTHLADDHPLWLVPLRDLPSFAVRIASLFGRSLVWKGERFVVAPSGHLEKEVSPPG